MEFAWVSLEQRQRGCGLRLACELPILQQIGHQAPFVCHQRMMEADAPPRGGGEGVPMMAGAGGCLQRVHQGTQRCVGRRRHIHHDGRREPPWEGGAQGVVQPCVQDGPQDDGREGIAGGGEQVVLRVAGPWQPGGWGEPSSFGPPSRRPSTRPRAWQAYRVEGGGAREVVACHRHRQRR